MKTNQIFRRALSLLLCLCMVLSLGITAFAADDVAAQADSSAFESNKSLNDGGDADPETYTIDIDALVNGEASEQHIGTPLDVAIIFDRSDSMSLPAETEEVRTIIDETDLTNYLKTLDTTKPDGYYRASILSSQGTRYYSDVTWGDDRYMCWEPMRYRNGQWEVFETCSATGYYDQYGYLREGTHGIVYESKVAGTSGYYGYWRTMSVAFKNFKTRRTANTVVSSTMPFRIAVPRLSKAQDAITHFINALNASADNLNGDKHTVSITSFGGSVFKDGYICAESDKFPLGANKNFAFYDTKWAAVEEYQSQCSYHSVDLAGSKATTQQKTELSNLFKALNGPYVFGVTRTDLVTAAVANDSNFLPAKKDGRERVIILMTDGCPTSGMAFMSDIANPALKTAAQLKKDGVQIYSLSFMEGLDPSTGFDASYNSGSEDSLKGQNFLHLYSSNYPTATAMGTTGANASNEFFFADDGTGNDLTAHLTSILDKITTKFETPLPGEKDSVSIYDEITREFMIDATKNVKVYIQKYNGNGSFGGKEYIGEHNLTTAVDASFTAPNKAYKLYWDCNIDKDDPAQPDVNLDISSIRLNWLDAKNGALREMDVTNEGSSYPGYTKGYKIGIELPIKVNRENTLGGNNILTNTSESGLFRSTTDETGNKPSGDKLITYDSPNANVEAKFETEVFDYFMDLEDLVANENADVNSTFAQAIFAAMLEDPEALAEYLKNNMNDYVNLSVYLGRLYSMFAAAGSDSFKPAGANEGATFDFTLDQSLNASANLTYITSMVDSIGVAPFGKASEYFTPNYYGPKYVVVDFDETVKTPLDKEAGLDPAVTGTNGAIEGSDICYNFRNNYASGRKSYLEKDYTVVPYQVEAINAPKAQAGNKIVDRKFYVIPANVMTYDDNFMTVDANGWEIVGRLQDGVQSHDNSVIHGYDDLYNGEYSKDYYHNALLAVTVSKTKGTAQAGFTINGTGFDIFAQTGPNSGTLAVEVSTDEYFRNDVRSYLVDTYLKDTTLNQIPVVRCDDLPYGTYYIRITAFYDSIFDHNYVSQWRKGATITEEALRERYGIPADADFTFIPSQSGYDGTATRAISAAANGQYNVYIDGFRVYNTINNVTTNAIANYGYKQAGEGFANIVNVNDGLVDATNANAWTEGSMTGVLYTAAGNDSADQDDTSEGIILGMEGALKVQADGSKFYVLKKVIDPETSEESWINVTYKGGNVYYRKSKVTSPNGRKYQGLNWFYDGGSAAKPMQATEIKEAFGGAMPVYYNAKYSQWGPEKEVYLANGQGVAFALSDKNGKVMISLKSHDGKSATLSVYDASVGAFKTLATTTSRVEMYYDITGCADANGYIFLQTTEGIVSICNIKTTTTAEATAATVYVNSALAAQAAKIYKDASLPVDGTADIKHSLDLASDISVNYVVSKDKLADYDYSYMEVSFNGETYFIEPEIRGDYGYFTVDGITAVDMTEKLFAKLHMFLGEEEFVSETDVYSVADYAYAQMDKAVIPAELKAVCANLLRYGALAQSFKGSDNAPADAAMTAEQKAYLTDLNTVSVASSAKALGDVENGIAWAGKSLVLDSKVAVKAIFDLTDFAGNVDALNLRVSYVNAQGEEVEIVVETAELYNTEKNFYAFTVDTLLATDMRCELTMALYEGDVQVSETHIYSVESYCASRTGALAELGKALLAYSDAAKAFFAK